MLIENIDGLDKTQFYVVRHIISLRDFFAVGDLSILYHSGYCTDVSWMVRKQNAMCSIEASPMVRLRMLEIVPDTEYDLSQFECVDYMMELLARADHEETTKYLSGGLGKLLAQLRPVTLSAILQPKRDELVDNLRVVESQVSVYNNYITRN